jgi:hypothetical protein
VELLSDEELREIFLLDGIHFRPQGHAWVAEEVADFLRAHRAQFRWAR